MFTSKNISLEDFERKMAEEGWQKKVVISASSWEYFYYTYVKTGKMEYSHKFHTDAPDVFWVRSVGS